MPTFEVKLKKKKGSGVETDYSYIIDIDNAVLAIQKVDEDTGDPPDVCLEASATEYAGKIYRKNIV